MRLSFLKSMGDGIGTAAGVAWPLFGVISGCFGWAVGTVTMITLGAVAAGIFILVAVPIAIWSYKAYIAEREATEKKHQEEKEEVYRQLIMYLLAILKICQKKILPKESDINDVVNAMKEEMSVFQDHLKKSSKLYTLLEVLKTSQEELKKIVLILKKENEIEEAREDEQQPLLKHELEVMPIIKKLSNAIFTEIESTPAPIFSRVKSGILGFCAGFGTILGCTAGTLGLLTGLGIFAGLLVMPFVGWAALGAAFLFGTLMAIGAVYHASKKIKLNEAISSYQDIKARLAIKNKDLDNQRITEKRIEEAKKNIYEELTKKIMLKDEKGIQKEITNEFNQDINVPWLKSKDLKKTSNDSLLRFYRHANQSDIREVKNVNKNNRRFSTLI